LFEINANKIQDVTVRQNVEYLQARCLELGSVFDFVSELKALVEKPTQTDFYALYVILFNHGVIKVGKGKDAMKRINTHARNASIFDRHIVKFFIENNPTITEEQLIEFCMQNGTLCNGNEYFKNLKYEQVLNFLKPKIERKPLRLVRSNNN
jgi:hypothetical protein